MRLAVLGLGLAMALGGCTVRVGEQAEPALPAATPTLAPGDRIRVEVAEQPDLSGTYELDLDGYVDLPLLGRVDAYGHDVDDLRTNLVAGYADGFLRNPVVTVDAVDQRPVFVSGDVLRPGSYAFVPGITVAGALERAGTDAATLANGSIRLIRHGADRDVLPDALLAPGDIVELRRSAG